MFKQNKFRVKSIQLRALNTACFTAQSMDMVITGRIEFRWSFIGRTVISPYETWYRRASGL